MKTALVIFLSALLLCGCSKKQKTPAMAKDYLQTNGEYPQMTLVQVLEPNNVFHDALFGVWATYPEGWSVQKASRWGQKNHENSVLFSPPKGSAAIPIMYYAMYFNGAPAPGNAEAMLREGAQKKEASRLHDGLKNYKNDPDSFVFRVINGHLSLSYLATFTQGGQVQDEYFMRIQGEKGFVMFFTHGPPNDVQALVPSVDQMAGTVKPP
jgi:hypothetical protein